MESIAEEKWYPRRMRSATSHPKYLNRCTKRLIMTRGETIVGILARHINITPMSLITNMTYPIQVERSKLLTVEEPGNQWWTYCIEMELALMRLIETPLFILRTIMLLNSWPPWTSTSIQMTFLGPPGRLLIPLSSKVTSYLSSSLTSLATLGNKSLGETL